MLDTLSIVKTPKAARRIFRSALWKIKTEEKVLYLTFDDGPISEVTPMILDLLKQYNARATFFCIGKNISTEPALFHRIAEEGHIIGNHTQDHLNGWHTDNDTYYNSVMQWAETKSAHMQSSDTNEEKGKEQTVFFQAALW